MFSKVGIDDRSLMVDKMLRGISSCLRGVRVQRNRLPGVYVLLAKDFSNGEIAENGGRNIDQSFTATHHTSDGRKFQFATVVAKRMKKGESSLRIWEQACALIGGNSPTLAVAFVSKPTVSAVRSMQEFASKLSRGDVHGSNGCSALKSCSETCSQEILSCATADPAAVSTEASERADNVPLIGCVMDDYGGEFEGSRVIGIPCPESSSASSRGELQVGTQVNAGGNELVTPLRDCLEEQQVFQRSLKERFRLEPSKCALNSDGMQAEEEDVEEGTLSDWEGLCSEYSEEAMKVIDLKADEDSDEEGETNASCPVGEISREGLVSFLNTLVKPRTPFQEPGGGGDRKALERTKGMQNREVKGDLKIGREVTAHSGSVTSRDGLTLESEQCMVDHGRGGVGLQPRHVGSQRELAADTHLGDVEATIIVEPRDGCDEGDLSGSDPEKEDVNYSLVLCLGHFPGAKAVVFHSKTTGLPRLPDLQNAVIENNPHMLLLGAPGFVFPEFIQRLSSVFPVGCRAGAFLAPLFNSKRSQWMKAQPRRKSCPLFFGNQIATSGVVGLAISKKEKEYEVPAGAFAEFARMSVGMPRLRGYIFLDEPVSKNLFLPKNVSVRFHTKSSKSSNLDRSTVLDHLSRRLLQESTVPAQVKSSSTKEVTGPEEGAVGNGACIGSLELISENHVHKFSGNLQSGSSEAGLGSRDSLPLAVLDSVLFPGWSMPFYIYEPCYRAMVRQCLEQGKPFGLSSISNEDWSSEKVESGEVIGTVAKLKVYTFEQDCRSYIIAHGVRRFKVVNERIRSEPGSFGLTVGQVQFFDDEECETEEERLELLELAKKAVSLCCEVMSEAQSAPGLVKSAHDPRLASFAVGHVLDVPARVKRRWLKMVSTKTRLLEQITFLETRRSSA